MDPITAGILLAATLLGVGESNKQRRLVEQQMAEEERRRQEAERRFQETYDQLHGMLSGILDPAYSAIPQHVIDQIVARAGQDISQQQRVASERALRDLARRGLAGSSLVDQRQVTLDQATQRTLSDARMRAEQAALEQTLGIQSQARNLLGQLAGMSAGMSQTQAQWAQQAAQQLLTHSQQAGNTFAQLAGTLLAPYMGQLFGQQPLALQGASTQMKAPAISWGS